MSETPTWCRYVIGDVIESLRDIADGSFNCCVTSPPYWGLRDYGAVGQLGLEATPEEYVARMVEVFREVRRVLRDDGTLWLNIGDSYAGSWGAQSRGGPPSSKSTLLGNGHVGGGPKIRSLSSVQIEQHPKTTRTGSLDRTPGLKPKDLVGIPWRVAFALQADGWYLRSDIIWSKPNPMPESVTDRPTKAHEYVFLMSKSERYHYDADAIREPDRGEPAGNKRVLGLQQRDVGTPISGGTGSAAWQPGNGRSKRTVWEVTTQPFAGAHFATFPPKLIEPCIMAGCPSGGVVLDPFLGSGTTAMVAEQLGRQWFGIELNPEYEALIRERTAQRGLFVGAAAGEPTE